ncbi:glycosyltransferase [Desulforhopalus vacuolatus]|uniref:glycosyltransferase family 2 protein n=1 Tax=Desulforhopalus vacuolatus TaxID=40414 RepID=UPI001963CB7E|nr:glycosyltransferase [Desulforhopalus vacuolatus]MBM9520715.1 glycosyltransferase [Desulforhopalus vacuolatus]
MAGDETPLISVVIPAYNHEKFIGAAIDSVLGQTVADFELIVIDDGSTDGTAAVVQEYNDPRLSFYHQENQDAFNTINRGLGMARGRYISILNSDDIYTTDRFARILACIERQTSTGVTPEVVITDVSPISDTGVIFSDPDFGWNLWHRKNRETYLASGDIYTAFLKGNFMVTTSNLFMTRRAVEKVGKFCSLRYLHDYDYIFRLMLAFPKQVQYLYDERLLFYRIHNGNTLGEAAIIGRRQDQQLIAKYMTEAVPQEFRQRIEAGAERLVELGDELHEVQQQLQPGVVAGVRPAAAMLAKSLRAFVAKKMKRN